MIRILLLLVLAIAAVPAGAQRSDVPRRPAVAAADTNDARTYLEHGARMLRTDARQAADAFYWAWQLDPSSADALYGRYTALLLSNPQRLVDYWNGERRVVRSPAIQAIDSLYFRALTMNPFLHRRFETEVFRTYMRTIARTAFDREYGATAVPENVIQGWINDYLQHGSPWLRAEEAYGQNRFDEALQYYDEAIREARRGKSRLRADRARLLAHTGNNPAAMLDFAQAIQEMRTEDERELVFLYESKALLEHAVGSLHERMGNRDAAREAYGRALTEDLAFYPAHVRLGILALAAGDTATAVSELDLAAQAGAVEPHVRYTYAAVLTQIGRLDEAAAQLGLVMAAAPHWADPYFVLGAVRDGQGNMDGAREAYQGFLSRSAAGHRRRPAAEARVRDLQAGGAGAAQPSGGR